MSQRTQLRFIFADSAGTSTISTIDPTITDANLWTTASGIAGFHLNSTERINRIDTSNLR